MMKKSLVLAMAMALGVTASAYAANPFSDVPAGHWAYDSIAKLADAGVIEGYGDTTFGGNKLMTRYEMAQIVAKAMARGANVDRLAAEFADELDALGVRVANLEKKADNVKITGEVRYHYADRSDDFNTHESKLRSRIWINGQINDDWSYTGMLENQQDFTNNSGDEDTDFQRAYVNGKLGGLKVQAGRYQKKLAFGSVYSQRMDGVEVSYGKDVKLTVGASKPTASKPKSPHLKDKEDNFADKLYYVDLSGKIGKLGLGAGYYKFDFEKDLAKSFVSSTEDKLDIWQVNANYKFDKNVSLAAMYIKGDDLDKDIDDDGYVFTAQYKGAKASAPGSWGLTAQYFDQGTTTYVDHDSDGYADKLNGFKGFAVAANYAFAKNIVGKVAYYDFEAKEAEKTGHKKETNTIWSELVFTF